MSTSKSHDRIERRGGRRGPVLVAATCEVCGQVFEYEKTTRTRLYCPAVAGETLSACQKLADLRRKNASRKLMEERAARAARAAEERAKNASSRRD